MTRIVLRIDRLRLHGIDASEGEAVARALQQTLADALRSHVDRMPSPAAMVAALQAGLAGSQSIRVTAGHSAAGLGSSVAHGIVRGWLP